MSGRRHITFCFKHGHGYYVTDGCFECNNEKVEAEYNRLEQIEKEKQEEKEAARSLLILSQLCSRCKKVKAWYNFKLHKNGKKDDTCFKCQENSGKAKQFLDKIHTEYRLERLIKKAMKNKLVDLRNHLFETLEGFRDGTVTLEKARGVCEIAQVIINSAKVEVDFIRAVGGKKSDFMQLTEISEGEKLKAVNQ